jgi:5-methylcytosine-specific restriction endonuclease McrA
MKKQISASQVSQYVKKMLGYSNKQNTSLYDLACIALEKEGIKKPDEISSRTFVNRSAFVLLEKIGGKSIQEKVKAKKEQKKVVKNNSYSFEKAKSKEFLFSYEWRKLRMEAIKKYGNSCQCCGASPKTGAVLNVDHIKPRKFFPHLALDIDNLQILCADCNHGKGNWDQTDWR